MANDLKRILAQLILAALMIGLGYWLQRRQNEEVILEQKEVIEETAGYIETLETELEEKQAEIQAMDQP